MKTIGTEKSSLLRDKAVCQLLSISRSYLWRMVRDGKLPKPVKLGPKLTLWKRADIEPVLRNPEKFFKGDVK